MSKRILIVEDDQLTREGLRRALESDGHCVTTSADSQEAGRVLAGGPMDVVLLDINLPDFPGDSLAAFLRLKYPETRIIFISGDYTVIDPERYGPDTVFLSKPLNMHELLSAINRDPKTRQHASLY